MKRKIYWNNIKHGFLLFLLMTGTTALITRDFGDVVLTSAIAFGITISNLRHDLKKLKK